MRKVEEREEDVIDESTFSGSALCFPAAAAIDVSRQTHLENRTADTPPFLPPPAPPPAPPCSPSPPPLPLPAAAAAAAAAATTTTTTTSSSTTTSPLIQPNLPYKDER